MFHGIIKCLCLDFLILSHVCSMQSNSFPWGVSVFEAWSIVTSQCNGTWATNVTQTSILMETVSQFESKMNKAM